MNGIDSTDLIGDLLNVLNGLLSTLSGTFSNLVFSLIGTLPQLLENAAAAAQNSLQNLANSFIVSVNSALSELVTAAQPLLAALNPLLAPIQAALGALAGPINSLTNNIIAAFNNLLTLVNNAANPQTAILSGNNAETTSLSDIEAGIARLASVIASLFIQIGNSVLSSIASLLTSVVSPNNPLVQAAGGLIVFLVSLGNLKAQIISQLATILAQIFPSLAPLLQVIASAAAAFVQNGNAILVQINTYLSGGGAVSSTSVTSLFQTILAALNSAIATFVTAVSPVISIPVTAVNSIAAGIATAVQSLISGLQTDVSSVIGYLVSDIGIGATIFLSAVADVISEISLTGAILSGLASGTLTPAQVVPLLAQNLNSLLAKLNSLVVASVTALQLGGDQSATIVNAVIVQTLNAALIGVNTTINVLANLNSPAAALSLTDLANLVQQNLNNLATGLQTIGNNFATVLSSIVNGLPTGILAIVTGLQSIVIGGLNLAASTLSTVVPSTVNALLADVQNTAAQIKAAITAAIGNLPINVNGSS